MSSKPSKGPLRWSGALFALIANIFLVSLTDLVIDTLSLGLGMNILATAVAPLTAGAATALYVKQRGGIHAFIGGLLSAPVLAMLIFSGAWQLGLLAGAFCGLGGSITEVLRRDRRRSAG